MGLTRLSLENFRIFDSAAFEPDPYGTTVLLGPNGTGKTSILEAVAYLASGRSFRGATRDSLVRQGEASAYLHGAIDQPGHLTTTVDAEINRSGPARMLINKQPARTRSDLSSAVTVTTFAPDDMVVVRGGPGARRELLDEALAALSPQAGPLLETVDRILRQRGALLKQAKGRLSGEVGPTLDVWDERLADAGTALIALRIDLCRQLRPEVARAYGALAGSTSSADITRLDYTPSFEGSLLEALQRTREDDLRRAQTTIGPHRDDLLLEVNGREARSQASQGEQRCLALSLRLAIHRLVTAHLGAPPILLLDDVFSELDLDRALRLIAELPAGQTLISSAVPLPSDVHATTFVHVNEVRRHV